MRELLNALFGVADPNDSFWRPQTPMVAKPEFVPRPIVPTAREDLEAAFAALGYQDQMMQQRRPQVSASSRRR